MTDINVELIDNVDLNVELMDNVDLNVTVEGFSIASVFEWGKIVGTLSDQTDLQNALNLKFNSSDFSGTFNTQFNTKTTDDLTEATNLYYTEARVSANTDVTANTVAKHTHANKTLLDSITDSGTGDNYLADDGTYKAVISDVTSVNTQTGVVVLTTTDISEGVNEYYTEAKVSTNADVTANTTDRHSHSNKTLLDTIIDSGLGDNYLSDDGTYKHILESSWHSEVPSGLVNGVNTIFNTTYTPNAGSLQVFKNGLAMSNSNDYSFTGTTITFVTAPATGNKLLTQYTEGSTISNDKADRDNVLELDNTDAYIPISDYHPATKKYVDDSIIDNPFDQDLNTTDNVEFTSVDTTGYKYNGVGWVKFGVSEQSMYLGKGAGSGSNNAITTNIGIGYDAIKFPQAGYNVGIGFSALRMLSSGTGNCAIGYRAGYNMSSGSGNFLLGRDTGLRITTGSHNIGIGDSAIFYLTEGIRNTCIGTGLGTGLTTGSLNTIIGYNAGDTISTEDSNTFIGYESGRLSVGKSCIGIGFRAGHNNNADNKLYISNSDTWNLIEGSMASNTTGWLTVTGAIKVNDGATTNTVIDRAGYSTPITSTDAVAPNNSIYYSSDASKLVYKDGSGIVNNLY